MISRLLFLILTAFALTLHAQPVGDGKADDTAAVQAMVDAGGAVRFGRGTYRMTKSVVIDLDKAGFISLSGDGVARFVMGGAGPAFLFKGTHGGTADPESLKPEIFARQRTPMVDGIEITGAHAEADGIEATGTMQLTIIRVSVHEARHGVRLGCDMVPNHTGIDSRWVREHPGQWLWVHRRWR